MLRSPEGYVRTALVGIGVLLLSILMMELATVPAVLLDPSIVEFDPSTRRLAIYLFLPLNFLGMAIGGGIYLLVTDRDWSWLDLHAPSRRDALWVIGGSAMTVVILLGGGVASQALDVQVPTSPLMELLREDVALLSFMLVTVWLLNAPAEELVYRNIIQKRAYPAFGGIGAVLFASALFALVHVPGYLALGADLVSVIVPTTIILLGAIVMGVAYRRTGNLWVPILIHAIFNTIQIAPLLLALLLGIDMSEEAAAVLPP